MFVWCAQFRSLYLPLVKPICCSVVISFLIIAVGILLYCRQRCQQSGFVHFFCYLWFTFLWEMFFPRGKGICESSLAGAFIFLLLFGEGYKGVN